MKEEENVFDLTQIINSNNIYGKLITLHGETLDNAVKWREGKPKEEHPNFWKTLKVEAHFLMGLFEYMGNTQRVFEQLQAIMCCYTHPPSKKVLKMRKIEKAAIQEYHLENFYHRVYTFRESVLHLINYLYFLKIKKRRINRESVYKAFSSNHKLYDKEIKKILDDIEDVLKPLNEIRRESVHYGKFNEKDLTILKVFERVSKNNYKEEELQKMKKEAQNLSDGILFKMIHIEHELLKIFKRLFEKSCSHGYHIYLSYQLQGAEKMSENNIGLS